MHDAYSTERQGRRWARLRQAGFLASALACLALLAAACSSPANPATGALTGGGSGKDRALAYSRCMRAHGISKFPDPNAQGNLSVNAGPGTGIDPNSPQFKAADNACKSLMSPPPMSPAQQAAARAGNLKYARCMRAHGIADFPDPNSQGAIQIQVQPGSDLNPNNPQFQAANNACQHYQTRGKGGSLSVSGSTGGGA
jgi:hypothetical protein